jgi:hypothetical protein
MPRGDIETFHQDGRWANRREAVDDHPWGYADTKEEAVTAGREVARAERVEHIIRNLDGTIGERNSYGNDPRTVKG